MSYQIHMKGYNDIRTLYQIDSLYAWKHNMYFPPSLVEISPTHMCNQKCRYCYTNNRGRNKEILHDDILINSFRQVADAGVKAILVQGTGEPLIHKALPKAIEVGAKFNLSIGLTTNGVLFNKKIQEKILEHLFFIRFSVLDNDPKRYAYLHGCSEKQWESLINNISNTILLREKNGLNFGLIASVYLYKDNFLEAYGIAKYFKEMGIDYINLQEASYTNFSPAGKEEYASKSYSHDEIEEMKEKITTLGDRDFCVKIRFPINDNDHFAGMNKECWKNNYCQGTNFYTIISSDGNVYPCWRFWGKQEYSYGSLYENSFDEIWKGEQRQQIDTFLNNTPPLGDECSVCNIVKINEILDKYKNATTKWKEFLM